MKKEMTLEYIDMSQTHYNLLPKAFVKSKNRKVVHLNYNLNGDFMTKSFSGGCSDDTGYDIIFCGEYVGSLNDRDDIFECPEYVNVYVSDSYRYQTFGGVKVKRSSKYCHGVHYAVVNNTLTFSGTGDITLEDLNWNDIPHFDHVKIENGITYIGTSVFNGVSFSSIELPGTLEAIGNYAFAGNTQLKEIDLPLSVSSIGKGAFSNCTSLERIRIPYAMSSSSRDISSETFEGCEKLTTVVYCGTDDLSPNANIFPNNKVQVIVMDGRYTDLTFARLPVTWSDDESLCEIIETRSEEETSDPLVTSLCTG